MNCKNYILDHIIDLEEEIKELSTKNIKNDELKKKNDDLRKKINKLNIENTKLKETNLKLENKLGAIITKQRTCNSCGQIFSDEKKIHNYSSCTYCTCRDIRNKLR